MTMKIGNFLPFFLCAIAMAALVIVPMYYFLVVHMSNQRHEDIALPFETEILRIEQVNGIVLVRCRLNSSEYDL